MDSRSVDTPGGQMGRRSHTARRFRRSAHAAAGSPRATQLDEWVLGHEVPPLKAVDERQCRRHPPPGQTNQGVTRVNQPPQQVAVAACVAVFEV